FIHPALGRLDRGKQALDRAIALCESHGDALHLVPSMSNRAMLRANQGDKAGMLADFERVLTLSRELGLGMLEEVGHFNLAEFRYLMDDLDGAELHFRQALAIEEKRLGDAWRPVIGLLEPRMLLHRGDEARAAEAAQRIRAQEARSPEAQMAPA